MSDSDSWKASIDFALLSDVGMRRANNQDAVAAIPADSRARFERRGHLFIVADGMGAHAAGELASRMAVEQIPQHYFQASTLAAPEALRRAVQQANAEVYARGRSNPEFHNMGTTVCALALLAEGAVVAHVGDSRVYRLRGEKLEQLTFDHSLVWEMEASGQVSPNSALGRSIPKNVITRSLGPNSEVMVDLEGPWPIRKGDRYLLCSDGLSGEVDDSEMGMLLGCLPPEKAVRVLVDLANLRGGPDNSTVLIVEALDDLTAPSSSAALTETDRSLPWPLMITGAVCLIVALFFGFLGMWPVMAITLVLFLVAAGFAVRHILVPPDLGVTPCGATGGDRSGGGPYRKYVAKPNEQLIDRLGGTVRALREAASENRWKIEWREIDQYQQESSEAKKAGRLGDAVRLQAEAIIETMQQLRKERQRKADDSSLDL
ncbi:MAG: protein phosphatase 2C domain-containing protein [Pirellulaceae bacterium]